MSPNLFFSSSAKVCYVIYLTSMSVVLFSFWYFCDNIHHHLGYEHLSEEEFVNHFRKLTNIDSKLFCFHHSTNQQLIQATVVFAKMSANHSETFKQNVKTLLKKNILES